MRCENEVNLFVCLLDPHISAQMDRQDNHMLDECTFIAPSFFNIMYHVFKNDCVI